ncbi:ankyrin repeat domain-containing protein [Wolbachia endosymbiont of Tettigetta isshikii]|uniref:ankyrin repeat domain-containing protein n=1 Tax=Wolbachia endosymbiont of Tettigetta isshikii TaxID=3239093 RepID=UPI00397FD1C2
MGVGIDDTDRKGITPLCYAIQKGHLEDVKFLVSKGANIYAENTYGIRLMHAASI